MFSKLIPDINTENFLTSPAWTVAIGPREKHVEFSTKNISLNFKLPVEHCISSVVKDNFTEPLIELLLSYSPSSKSSKSGDLELIEILARHAFQRKGKNNLYVFYITIAAVEYLRRIHSSLIHPRVCK